MSKQFTIRLDSVDVGQVLDGIEIRAESWRRTADLLESGYNADDSFVAEECSDPEEAMKIADHYERIARSIKQQVLEQGGW